MKKALSSLRKKKLTIDEQIEHMKGKGVKFDIVSEDQAKEFLLKKNYYFKLKAYAKNYEKYHHGEKQGQYINLEFAYLQELSTIDMHFRYFIIEACLNLEHSLKVKLLNDCSEQILEDGYKIIEDFFSEYPNIQLEIKGKKAFSVCSDLIEKYEDEFAIWNVVEILSFGEFIRLYEFYYERYEDKSSFSKSIFPIRLLRNAAAHNNCLINSLTKPYSSKINANAKLTRFVSKIPGIGKRDLRNKMSNPVIHDFVLLLYIFSQTVENEEAKLKTYAKLKWLFNERIPKNKEYFSKNQNITSVYDFVKKVVDFLINNRI